MAEPTTTSSEKILSLKIGEELTQAQMKRYAAELEEKVAQVGPVRLLIIMEKFPKIEPAAFWEDLKLSTKYYKDIDRIALVGQPEWEKWYAKLANLWPSIEVKHFDPADMERAYEWLEQS